MSFVLTDLQRLAPALISVDVGGTLGRALGRTMASRILAVSELPAAEARSRLRATLQVARHWDDGLVDELCHDLHISKEKFPNVWPPPTFEAFPGAVSAVHALTTYAPVVTISNVCVLDADDSLRRIFQGAIAAEYRSFELGYAKPDPRAFLLAAARQGVSPSRVLHVGDSWDCDIIGGASAGMAVIWISHGQLTPATPDWIKPFLLGTSPDLRSIVAPDDADRAGHGHN